MKWFLTGLGLGTAIGILYAPRSGSETQRRVRGMADQAFVKAREASDAITQQVQSTGSRVQDAARAARTKVQDTVDEVKSGRSQQKGNEVAEELPIDFLGIINEWPHERLIEIDGIGPVLASKIISNRPYDSAEDLVDSKLLPPSAIASLRKAS
jgi:gas vesicle protein